MPVRPRRHRGGASNVVAAFLRECEDRVSRDRTVREQAIVSLRFFPPLNEALRTPAALRELWEEFGDELSPGSWLARQIAVIEGA